MNDVDFLNLALKNLPIARYFKDKEGRFKFVNRIWLDTVGLHSENDMIQRTDFELPWKEQALQICKNDQKVLNSLTPSSFIECARGANGNFIYALSYKYPQYSDQGKLLGVAGYSMLMVKPTSGGGKDKKSLSKMQLECLYHLVLGNTVKEIANILSLSIRTVEHYLEHIKIKLNCYSRAELVAKAMDLTEIKHRIATLIF